MDLTDLIEEQQGAFLRSQATACGFSVDQIAHRLRQRVWVPLIGRRVLALPSAALSTSTREWAAHLACGPGTVLAGPSAARRWDVEVLGGQPGHVWVITATSRRCDLPAWASALRWPLAADEVDLADQMLITTRERSIVDTLRILPFDAAERTFDRARQRRQITVDQIAAAASRFADRAGAQQLRRLVGEAVGAAESRAERLLHAILRRGRVRGWVANLEVYDGHGLIGRVDAGIEGLKLALEVDGRAYHDGRRFQSDRTRQNRLVAAGWTVLRFTWEDLRYRPEQVLALIRTTIARLEAVRAAGAAW